MYTVKHTFFCDSIEEGYLSEEESNHAIRVLRLKEGQGIKIVDGKGQSAIAEIVTANKKKLGFNVKESYKEIPPSRHIHIAIAPTKSMDRFSFFIEKVIEIGIEKITPLRTKNSERKELKIEKIRKNAIGALKQSGNLFLPKIEELTDYQDFISNKNENAQCFIAHCEEDGEKKELKNEIDVKKNVIILIGPEGDFTPEEINLAKKNTFLPVSLGSNRLRTETAGIVACHTINII